MLLGPPKSVQFSKLSLELVDKNVKIVKKSLSLKGLLMRFIYREVINYLRIRFILVSSYSV